MMSLAQRIARIATSSKPAPNSAHLLKYLTEAAVRARSRFNSFYHELDGSMLAHPEGHFTQALFHAEMLSARGQLFKVLPRLLHPFHVFPTPSLDDCADTLRCRLWLIQKMRRGSG